MNYFLFSLFLLGIVPGALLAQGNEAERVKERIPVAGNERNDVIFSRTFMLGESPDGVFLSGSRTGSSSIGVSIGIPVGKAFEVKFEPRATWLKLYYDPTMDTSKVFPSAITDEDLVFEKQRAFYLEVPIGFRLKLARNSRDNYKFLLEGGFNFGLNLGASSKSRFNVDLDNDGNNDSFSTIKTNGVNNLELLRYGPYGRIGTNWIQIYGFYRLSDIFESDATFNTTGTDMNFPAFPALELGFSISL